MPPVSLPVLPNPLFCSCCLSLSRLHGGAMGPLCCCPLTLMGWLGCWSLGVVGQEMDGGWWILPTLSPPILPLPFFCFSALCWGPPGRPNAWPLHPAVWGGHLLLHQGTAPVVGVGGWVGPCHWGCASAPWLCWQVSFLGLFAVHWILQAPSSLYVAMVHQG